MTDFPLLNEWLPYFIIGAIGLIGILIFIFIFSRNRKPSQKSPSSKITAPNQSAKYKSEHLGSDRLREVYKLIIDLTSTLNYQRVLDRALDLSMQALTTPNDPTDRLVCAVLLFSDTEDQTPELYIGASRRFTRSDLRHKFPAQSGLLKSTIDEGVPLHIRDLSKDPELGRLLALQSCNSAYCIPLRQGLDTYGVLLFTHPDHKYFNVARREILDLIGNQSVVALQNAQLYYDLEQEKERMMEIQEDARKKLARDLHDGPTQSIAAIAMRVNFARRLMERDAGAAAEELYKIEDLARRTTKEIRHMLFTLRPLVLESQGLTAAIQSMAEKLKETYNQNVVVEIDANIENELEMGKLGVIFAITEEAVNNARKYAQANHIWVRLRTIQEDLAVLEIEDDGVGFDLESVDASYEQRGSLGLVNMRERAELVNGIINMKTAPGEGMHVQVIIPLTEDATDRLHRS